MAVGYSDGGSHDTRPEAMQVIVMRSIHLPGLPFILRLALGAVWIAGAVVNAVWTLPGAEAAWADLADNATFAPYRWFFADVAGAAPALWAVLLILAELTLGVLLLARDPWARNGVILSIAWSVFLFFLIWPYTLSTVIFGAMAALLLRVHHPRSVLDLLHRDRPLASGGPR